MEALFMLLVILFVTITVLMIAHTLVSIYRVWTSILDHRRLNKTKRQ